MQITKQHLEFLEEAKIAFLVNVRWDTYFNDHSGLIALRFGPDRDCIRIYELGDEVGFFAQMIDQKSKTPDATAYER
ncbi:hypothetical protein AB4Z17_11720 [Paenibacillus sp. TAF43_2]|uniref:hypothetical protein n=1 Tax=Paenibacillus sp. TAF43_2 TaxID=3233069 RepID=UPI003F96D367